VAKEKTGVGSKEPGQPTGTAVSPGTGVQAGVPPKEPTAEFDFKSVPPEAWKSGKWYEHVPSEAVNLDKFPQFGKFKSERDKSEATLRKEMADLQAQVQQLEQMIEYQELEGLKPEEREGYELQKLREERAKSQQDREIEAAWDAAWEQVCDQRDGLAEIFGLEDPEKLEINVELFYKDPNLAIADLRKQAKEIAEEIATPTTPPPLTESHAGGAPSGGLIEEVAGKPPRERQRIYSSHKQVKRLLEEAGSRK